MSPQVGSKLAKKLQRFEVGRTFFQPLDHRSSWSSDPALDRALSSLVGDGVTKNAFHERKQTPEAVSVSFGVLPPHPPCAGIGPAGMSWW